MLLFTLKIVVPGLLENSELCQMDKLMGQSQNKNS